jgi:exopolysaccharide production protein ExoZ
MLYSIQRALREGTVGVDRPASKLPTVLTVQYLRALAASLIVFHHSMSPPVVAPYYPIHFAECGVDLFFVISGFIMWTTTSGGKRSPLRFWAARIARIVPLYWIFTALFIAAMLLAPAALFNAPTLSPGYILKSYLFIPTANGPVYSLGWTLNYEMFFYLIFGLCLLITQRTLRLSALAVIFVGLVAIGRYGAPQGAALSTYTNNIMLEFLGGVVIAVCAPRLNRLPAPAALALMAAGILLIAYDAWTGLALTRVVGFGIPAMLVVAGMLGFEERAQERPSRVLLLLGDASYSIYLAHPFAQRILYSVMVLFWPGLATPLASVLYVIGAMIAGLIGGVVSYLMLERPLLAKSRRLIDVAAMGFVRHA